MADSQYNLNYFRYKAYRRRQDLQPSFIEIYYMKKI